MDVCDRFRNNLDSQVVEEFNKLQQDGSQKKRLLQ